MRLVFSRSRCSNDVASSCPPPSMRVRVVTLLLSDVVVGGGSQTVTWSLPRFRREPLPLREQEFLIYVEKQ